MDGTIYHIYSNTNMPGTGWGTAQPIEAGYQNAIDPQVAMSANGQALAVWREYNVAGGRYDVYANAYMPNWNPHWWYSGGQLIENNAGSAYAPQLAMDVSGNATVVWHQWDGARNNIWGIVYTQGAGWGTARLMELDDAGTAMGARVAMDGLGNVVAVWQQHDGVGNHVKAARYKR